MLYPGADGGFSGGADGWPGDVQRANVILHEEKHSKIGR